jgi:predicted DNA binding CopG/RHH family protein
MSSNEEPKVKGTTGDLGYPTGRHGRIPSFASVEEEAAFWDTHDITDYLDESWPVENPVSPELRKQRRLTIRLDEADERALGERARSLGIGPSTLVRIWIRERLAQERKAS